MLVTVIACLVLVLCFNFYIHLKRRYWRRQGIPCVPMSFLFGKYKYWVGIKNHPLDMPFQLYKDYCNTGLPFVGMSVFTQTMLVLLDVDVIKNVLIKDFSKFNHRGIQPYDEANCLMNNLNNVEGAQWKKIRPKLATAFTTAKLKAMFPNFLQISNELSAVVAEHSSRENVVDMKDYLQRYTNDIIAIITLGIKSNSLRNQKDEFYGINRILLKRYSVLKDVFFQYLAFMPNFLLIVPKLVTEFYINIVTDTIAYRKHHDIKKSDFLQLHIDWIDAAKNPLTIQKAAGQVFFFVLAGQETSSSTLSFLLYELSLHPEIQERLRSEILQVLQKNNNEVTYELLDEMPYFDKVYSEVLRKYPVVGGTQRICAEDYQVPNSNYTIKANTLIIIPNEAVHRDARFYEDPDKFDPERFTSEEIQKRPACSFIPFGDGPRNCIGMRIARLQIYLGVIALLRDFRFGVAKTTTIPVELDTSYLVRTPRGKVNLKVEKL